MKMNIIIFLIGLFFGALLMYFLLTPPKEKIVTNTIIKENSDTSKTFKDFTSKSPANINYEKVKVTPIIPIKDTSDKKDEFEFEKIATWDTVTNDGFEAHIKYFISQELFENYFKIPEKVITNTKYVETTKTITNVIKELPKIEVGIGSEFWYSDNKVNYYPYFSFTYNKKILFLNGSIEAKGITSFDNGDIRMEPKLEAKLKYGF